MSRNFSKYKNAHILSKCISLNSHPCKARTVIEDFGYNKGGNITMRKDISDECGKKNSNNIRRTMLFNIDAPVFIPGEKVYPLNNIYMPQYILREILKENWVNTLIMEVLFFTCRIAAKKK